MPFFDRDTKKTMADEAIKLFAAFVTNPHIDATLSRLEVLRTKHYPEKHLEKHLERHPEKFEDKEF